MSHTPGPWRACTGSHKDRCICGMVYGPFKEGPLIATVAVERCPKEYHSDECSPPTDQSAANARLVAAAPDLLAACKDMVDLVVGLRQLLVCYRIGGRQVSEKTMDAIEGADERIAVATGAIAKAEGKS